MKMIFSELLDIYNDIILHTTAVYQYEIHTLEMRREWFTTKQQQGFPVFVAEENGILIQLQASAHLALFATGRLINIL